MHPTNPPVCDLTLAATPSAVSRARRHTVDVLRRWQLTSDNVDTVRLLVSELTTNAVRHAKPAPEFVPPSPFKITTISLKLCLTELSVLVLISDRDPRPPARRTADKDAMCGRGLLLTEAMASRWGYYRLSRNVGKVVWAEVPVQLPPAAGRLTTDLPPKIAGC